MFSENIISKFRNDFNTLGGLMADNLPKRADHVIGRFSVGLCPEMQFIGWEALSHKDMPNGINENGIYIRFQIDLIEKSVEVFDCGSIYLSREEQKATYLAMASIKDIARARGVKWLRKQKYKDVADLYSRIKKFYDNAMEAVNDYTQGYPYKQGIGWVYPKWKKNTIKYNLVHN